MARIRASPAKASVALVNTDLAQRRAIDPASVIALMDGSFGPWEPAGFAPGQSVILAPGELHVFQAPAAGKGRAGAVPDADAARRFANRPARGDRGALALRR